MSRRVLLATRSRHKVREVAAILAPWPDLRLLSLDDAGLTPSSDEEGIESEPTFLGNALAKAAYFGDRTGLPTLADDSGLEVEALGNAPGVRSRRFSGRIDLDGAALDDANNRLLLERLAGVPDTARAARYVCVAALVTAHIRAASMGVLRGSILFAGRGGGGFGYDPLFEVAGVGRAAAELTPAEKNTLSHRGRAFRGLAPRLPGLLRSR